MKFADVVNMKSAVVQFSEQELRGSVTFKAVPGHQFVFLYLGTQDMKNPDAFSARERLKAMGWVPGPALQAMFDEEAVDAGPGALS